MKCWKATTVFFRVVKRIKVNVVVEIDSFDVRSWRGAAHEFTYYRAAGVRSLPEPEYLIKASKVFPFNFLFFSLMISFRFLGFEQVTAFRPLARRSIKSYQTILCFVFDEESRSSLGPPSA